MFACVCVCEREREREREREDCVIRDQLGISELTDSSKFLKEVRQPIIDALIQNIEDRFQDIEVINQLAILDLSGTEELPSMYGLNEIEGLVHHFNFDSDFAVGEHHTVYSQINAIPSGVTFW